MWLASGHDSHASEPGEDLNVPETHLSHAVPSEPVWPTSHTQDSTLLWSKGLLPELAGHASQAVSAVLPVSARYFPEAQSSHSPAPMLGWYVPLSHKWQCGPPLKPCEPALHLHAASSSLPAALLPDFSGHEEHVAEPETALYVPGEHCEHVWPSGPVYPG